MAIDLRNVEPLGSKSVLLEQAIRNNKSKLKPNGESYLQNFDFSDMISPDYEWLNQDKSTIQNLVHQMDASIGQLAEQLREMGQQTRHIDQFTRRTKAQFEEEQKLLYKQIHTLNGLLKRQIEVMNGVEKQLTAVEIKQNNFIPQMGIGVIAGLMSAVTILVTAPWVMMLIEHLRT
ncbi:MAG: hypothetical protein RBS36_06015 [Thiomicrospira sp.]|jgi:uncharacterized protein YukE|nr:hypothetical protein [Thiomicrospira sp.]